MVTLLSYLDSEYTILAGENIYSDYQEAEAEAIRLANLGLYVILKGDD